MDKTVFEKPIVAWSFVVLRLNTGAVDALLNDECCNFKRHPGRLYLLLGDDRCQDHWQCWVCAISLSTELPDMRVGQGDQETEMHTVRWWLPEDVKPNLRLYVL